MKHQKVETICKWCYVKTLNGELLVGPTSKYEYYVKVHMYIMKSLSLNNL